MLPPKKNVAAEQERKLLAAFQGLDKAQRENLLAYAEFLIERQGGPIGQQAPVPSEPLPIPRPDEETVIAAIRRLAETYPMLNRDELLHEASTLMGNHVMHGKPAPDAIDELQALFAGAFERYAADDSK